MGPARPVRVEGRAWEGAARWEGGCGRNEEVGGDGRGPEVLVSTVLSGGFAGWLEGWRDGGWGARYVSFLRAGSVFV